MKHPKKERTLVILKPDSIQRSFIGDVIKRLEKSGLKLAALKMLIAGEKELRTHYNINDQWLMEKGQKMIENLMSNQEIVKRGPADYGESIANSLIKFMTCGPIIIMVWEGNQAVAIVKKITGSQEPLTSDVGTIRGDYTIDSYEISDLDNRAVRNLVHCSDSLKEATREIAVWFSEDEIIKYRLISEEILYDVNIDGFKE